MKNDTLSIYVVDQSLIVSGLPCPKGKAMTRAEHNSRPGRSSKWITAKKRKAIYARDDNQCVYCCSQRTLTLDHLKPRCKGGNNDRKNLVTACQRCNSARQERPVRGFCIAVGGYTGEDWREIVARIKSCRSRILRFDQVAE